MVLLDSRFNKRILVKSNVVGLALQGTWLGHAYDGNTEIHVVRLDKPANGREYLCLKDNEFFCY
jgi:hypothetical protein